MKIRLLKGTWMIRIEESQKHGCKPGGMWSPWRRFVVQQIRKHAYEY